MTNYDPFLRPKNQISFLWKRLVGGSNIYYENSILVQSEYSNIILKIKSFTFNKNYKRECKEHSSKCVSNFPVLEELTDYQLFLCNSQFQELIYKIFNCTPFYSSLKNKHMNECPVKITLLIYETLIKFEKDLFNCEFSIGKSPIEFLQTHHSKPYFNHVNDYFTGIDFRDVKLFEEKIKKNGPNSFELVVNIANIFGLCAGLSIFTIYESVHILMSCKIKNKINGKF
jgi:hypothetical protein